MCVTNGSPPTTALTDHNIPEYLRRYMTSSLKAYEKSLPHNVGALTLGSSFALLTGNEISENIAGNIAESYDRHCKQIEKGALDVVNRKLRLFDDLEMLHFKHLPHL